MDRRSCPACGRLELAYWREATASDPQLAGRSRFALERCAACGTAVTVGDGVDGRCGTGAGELVTVRGVSGAGAEAVVRVSPLGRGVFGASEVGVGVVGGGAVGAVVLGVRDAQTGSTELRESSSIWLMAL